MRSFRSVRECCHNTNIIGKSGGNKRGVMAHITTPKQKRAASASGAALYGFCARSASDRFAQRLQMVELFLRNLTAFVRLGIGQIFFGIRDCDRESRGIQL